MSNTNSSQEHFWFHRCGVCSLCFSAAKLAAPCPKCKDDINRDTISHNFYLHERYGEMTPEEWSTTLAIEDLTNPVDAEEDEESGTPNPLFERLLEHVGHRVSVVQYANTRSGPVNVAVECLRCCCVIIDADATGGRAS